MEKRSRIGVVLSIVAIWVVCIGAIIFMFSQNVQKDLLVPIKNEIERAITVKGLENKFVFAKQLSFFGAAGGGGLGAPMVICWSAKQFIDLIPPNETVYTAIEYPVVEENQGFHNYNLLKKVYWAFIESRAGLMVYEDFYSYDKPLKGILFGGDWDIVRYNQNEILFRNTNIFSDLVVTIIFTIVLILAVVVVTCVIKVNCWR